MESKINKTAPGSGGKRKILFKGITADAKRLGITRMHLYRVLTGRCPNNKGILERYRKIKIHGAPPKTMTPQFQKELLAKLEEISASITRHAESAQGTRAVFEQLAAQATMDAVALKEAAARARETASVPFPEAPTPETFVAFPLAASAGPVDAKSETPKSGQ